ncbi:hypothetical protein FC32_GL000090 [Ligilactobacillus apodemi DSM 16634 = JCM 16172]|uniref:Uncharacterized protein n=1 Tax=Ligilactobacillus apodemi DSM 16634 = JCM 16172 TaxID=1423724 RepID=A0A0R1TWT2_9LACO|nr:hypothetical protein FC32_GL000090 [Ligilactobacillus apodemi DSM 16634 = JCM 16172]
MSLAESIATALVGVALALAVVSASLEATLSATLVAALATASDAVLCASDAWLAVSDVAALLLLLDTVELDSVGACLLFSTCVFSFTASLVEDADALSVEEVVEDDDAFALACVVAASLVVEAAVSEVGVLCDSVASFVEVVEVDASSSAVTLLLLSVTLLSLIVEAAVVSVVSALELEP